MPSNGLPILKISLSGLGAFLAYTLAGPPENIIPFGAISLITLAGVLYGRSSQYTFASRIRLQMRWLYWEPKSRTTILSILLSSAALFKHPREHPRRGVEYLLKAIFVAVVVYHNTLYLAMIIFFNLVIERLLLPQCALPCLLDVLALHALQNPVQKERAERRRVDAEADARRRDNDDCA